MNTQQTMNIFEQATRQKLRFITNRGELATEDLWVLPLVSKSGFDLDTVAKTANAALKGLAEESFVAQHHNPATALATLRLDIIKHVIAVKLETNELARKKAAWAAEKATLMEILANSNHEALKKLSPEELQARIAELSKLTAEPA